MRLKIAWSWGLLQQLEKCIKSEMRSLQPEKCIKSELFAGFSRHVWAICLFFSPYLSTFAQTWCAFQAHKSCMIALASCVTCSSFLAPDFCKESVTFALKCKRICGFAWFCKRIGGWNTDSFYFLGAFSKYFLGVCDKNSVCLASPNATRGDTVHRRRFAYLRAPP